MTKKIDEIIEINDNLIKAKAVYYNTKTDSKFKQKPKKENVEIQITVAKKIPEKVLVKNKLNVKSVGKTQIKTFRVKAVTRTVNITQKELEKGMLSRAKKLVKEHYERKKSLFSFAFVAINIIVILAIFFQQQLQYGISDFWLTFSNSKVLRYLSYTLLAFIAIMLLEGLRTYILIYRTTKYNKPLLSLKSAITTLYYDNLVPIAGGKPFELYYLNKRGIKPSIATSVPLAKYSFSLVASIVVSTVVIISKWSFLQETSRLVLWLGIAMLTVNTAIVIGMLVFGISQNLGAKVTLFVLRLLERMHIIKDHQKYFYKFMRFVLEYQKSVQYYVKTKYVAIISLLCSFLITLLHGFIPFLIYSMFGTTSWEIMLDIMSKYYIMKITLNFIPVPGSAGLAEVSFAVLFNSYFVDGTLFWALLIWRVFSYYAFLAQGLVVVIYDYIVSKRNELKKFTDPKKIKTKTLTKEIVANDDI